MDRLLEAINDHILEGGLPNLVGRLPRLSGLGKKTSRLGRQPKVDMKAIRSERAKKAHSNRKAEQQREFDRQPILMRHPKYPGEKGRFWS
jgi:hypothetical protein